MSFPAAAPCPACGAALWAEARFCHRCGAPVPGAAPTVEASPPPTARATPPARESRLVTVLPWLVAAVAVGALVALLVGQRLGLGRAEPPADRPLDGAAAPAR